MCNSARFPPTSPSVHAETVELVPEAERWIERRQRSTEEKPSLQRREQARADGEGERLRHEPPQHGAPASRPEKRLTGAALETVQGPHIRLTQLLNPGECAPGDRPPAEPGINLLGGDRRGRQRHVHTDRPRG